MMSENHYEGKLSKGTELSAGYDLRATIAVDIPAGDRALVSTGVRVEIASGQFGMVCSRSGMALKHGVSVLSAPGIIDSDYRGQIGVILINHSKYPYHVGVGDKVAQLVVTAHGSFTEGVVGSVTERGEGGFGSTGK